MTTLAMPKQKIKCVIPVPGGKRKLAAKIIQMLGDHKRYYELMVGGCSVIFAKDRLPGQDEYLFDKNPNIINALRVIRDQPIRLTDIIGCRPFDRKVFHTAQLATESPTSNDPVLHVANLMTMWWMGANGMAETDKKQWFAARKSKTGGSPVTRWNSLIESIPAMSERLQQVRTIICQDVINDFNLYHIDVPGSAIYVDPPYIKKTFAYKCDMTAEHHKRLAVLLNTFRRARVVLSYYDDPILRTYYPPERWTYHEVEVSKNLASATSKTAKRAIELLICNKIPDDPA